MNKQAYYIEYEYFGKVHTVHGMAYCEADAVEMFKRTYSDDCNILTVRTTDQVAEESVKKIFANLPLIRL